MIKTITIARTLLRSERILSCYKSLIDFQMNPLKSPNLMMFYTSNSVPPRLLHVSICAVEGKRSLFMAFQTKFYGLHQKLGGELTDGLLWSLEGASMAGLMDLPFELLNTIVLLMVVSLDGARELARASAICKRFRTLANQPHILRVVNLQNVSLHGQCGHHHHINGLLSRCVRAGNLTAEWMLGQAVINGGSQLWRQMLESNLRLLSIRGATVLPLWQQRYIAQYLQTGSIADVPYALFCSEDRPHVHESYKRLLPWRLVRSFLAQAHPRTIFDVCEEVEEFVGFFVGNHVAEESGINLSIVDMSFYEINATPDALRRIEAGEHRGDDRLEYLATLHLDRYPSYRDRVLSIFDDVFPPRPL